MENDKYWLNEKQFARKSAIYFYFQEDWKFQGIAFPTLDKITIAKSQVLVYNES